jgi:hypothetical protein
VKSKTQNSQPILHILVKYLFLVLFIVGMVAAVRHRWICDDSFISIRYADNLVNGLGLVYNAGEYVEGFTNLLWTLMLAGASRVGISPVSASQYLGIVFYGLLVLSLAGWTWRRSRARKRLFMPLAAALVLISNDYHVWASGGLETMLFTYLAVQAFILLRTSGASFRSHIAAGCFFSLLVLTRPDGLLFAGLGILSCAIPASRYPGRIRFYNAICVLSPIAVTMTALIAFKLSYYGELFPTAFYSKSVLDPYFSKGFFFLYLYIKKNWIIAVTIVVLTATWAMRAQRPPEDKEKWNNIIFVSVAFLFLTYIASVGGDFMFARRILPAIPFVFLVFEEVIAMHTNKLVYAGLIVLLLVGMLLPFPVYNDTKFRIGDIADERKFYTAELIEARRIQAELVRKTATSPDIRVAFEYGMCVFGYYSKLPYLVEVSGLTQYSLAKSPKMSRGHIGHEINASNEWLKKNDIHLKMFQLLPKDVAKKPQEQKYFNEIYFGNKVKGEILFYVDEIMDCMRDNPDVAFVPIEKTLEQARNYIENTSSENAEIVFKQLSDYYFRGAGEKGRREAAILREIIDSK